MRFTKPIQVLLFVMIKNWHYLYFFCESEEQLGVKEALHVLFPLVVVEGGELLHLREHFECSRED